MNLMLTAEELEQLSGCKRPGKQGRWLRRNGMHYRVNDCGEVIVARAIAERFLGVAAAPVKPEADLDWPAMRAAGIVSRQ